MATVPVYNLSREEVGHLDLDDTVFSVEVNEALFYDVVKAQLASRRAGTHKVKNRSEGRSDRQEDVPPEGHGPGASRRRQGSAVPGWRSRLRPEAP